jgi:hypothetical protein
MRYRSSIGMVVLLETRTWACEDGRPGMALCFHALFIVLIPHRSVGLRQGPCCCWVQSKLFRVKRNCALGLGFLFEASFVSQSISMFIRS